MALSNALDAETIGAKLETWLKTHHADAVITEASMPSKSGLSAETVMFTAIWDGTKRHLVARVKPTGQALFMHYKFDLEFKLLDYLSQHSNVPVPAPVFLENGSDAIGSPFYVMTRAFGRVAEDDPPFTMDGWVLELSAEERSHMSDAGLRTLAELHKVDPKQTPLFDSLYTPATGANANLQHIAYWREFFDWAREGDSHPLIEHGLNWLEENAPNDDDRLCLCWGDSRLGNMIIDDNLDVAAVLDWEMVTVGAPELDLAWWIFLMEHHSKGVGATLPEGLPNTDGMIARYESFSGKKVENLDYYMKFAGVRLSILILRAANLMIGAGLLPPDAQMGRLNPAANLTAELFGISMSSETGEYYFGNR